MKKFTPEEDKFIRENYLTIPGCRMSKMLGRYKNVVPQRMRLLGIRPPLETIERFKQESRIQPGTPPPNKGKKWNEFMSAEGQAASRKTNFRKGHLPHNTKFDGALSVRTDFGSGRAYIHIRLSLANWVMLHVHIWEQENGPVPEGYVIIFKDGDNANVDLSNLECISQANNMRRNSIHHLPDDIKSTIRLTMRLDRRIKKLTKKLNDEEQKLGSA